MEEDWIFSTPTSLNTETPKSDGHSKVQREMGAVIEEMTNISEQLWSRPTASNKMKLQIESINQKLFLQ